MGNVNGEMDQTKLTMCIENYWPVHGNSRICFHTVFWVESGWHLPLHERKNLVWLPVVPFDSPV